MIKKIDRNSLEFRGYDYYLAEKIDEIIDVLNSKESKQWHPKLGDKYWLILDNGHMNTHNWDGDDNDNAWLSFGNVFSTKEEAEDAAKKVKDLLKSLHQ